MEETINPLTGLTYEAVKVTSPDKLTPLVPASSMLNPLTGTSYNLKPNENRVIGNSAADVFEYRRSEPLEDFKKYGVDIYPNTNLEQERSGKQSTKEQIWGAFVQGNATVIGETIEGLGYLADLVPIIGNWGMQGKSVGDEVANFGRSIMESARELDPIYEEKPGKFNPGDPGYWASNYPSVMSALGLLIPGAIGTKGLSYGGRALRAINKVDDAMLLMEQLAQKTGVGLRNIQNFGQIATRATVNRHLESMMEAAGTREQVYERLLNTTDPNTGELITSDKASRLADESAAQVYRQNWWMLSQDLLQFGALARIGGKMSTRVSDKLLLESLGVKKGIAKGIRLAVEGLSEGGEEAFQHVVQREGDYLADRNVGIAPETSFGQRLSGYVQEDAMLTSALFGALGGVIFSGGHALKDRLLPSKFKTWEEKQREYEIKNRGRLTNYYYNALKEAEQLGNKEVADFVKAQMVSDLGIRASKLGNIKNLKQWIDDVNEENYKEFGINNYEEFLASRENIKKDIDTISRIYDETYQNNDERVVGEITRNKFLSLKLNEQIKDLNSKMQAVRDNVLQDSLTTTGQQMLNHRKQIDYLKNMIKVQEANTKHAKSVYEDIKKVIGQGVETNSSKRAHKDWMMQASQLTSYEKKLEESKKQFDEITDERTPSEKISDKNILDVIDYQDEHKLKVKKEVAENTLKNYQARLSFIQDIKNQSQEAKEMAEDNKKIAEQVIRNKENIVDKENVDNAIPTEEKKKVEDEVKAEEALVLSKVTIESVFNNDADKNRVKEVLKEANDKDHELLTPGLEDSLMDEFESNEDFRQRIYNAIEKVNTSIEDVNNDFNVLLFDPYVDSLLPPKPPQLLLTGEAGQDSNALFVLNFEGRYSDRSDYGADYAYINNPETLKHGTDLHLEFDPKDKFNTPEKGIFKIVLVHYIDGNTSNKTLENRKVVGMLKEFADNQQNEETLSKIRGRFVDDYNKSKSTTASFTVKIQSKYTGRFNNVDVFNKPTDVETNPVIGLTKPIGGKNIIKFPDSQYDEVWSVEDYARGAYMMVTMANGQMYPAKIFMSKLKDNQAKLDEVIDLFINSDRSNYKENKEKILDIVSLRFTYPGKPNEKITSSIIFLSPDGKTKTVINKTDPQFREKLTAYLSDKIMHVDYNKLNRGDYNKYLADNGILTTDINPAQHAIETSFTISYEEATSEPMDIPVEETIEAPAVASLSDKELHDLNERRGGYNEKIKDIIEDWVSPADNLSYSQRVDKIREALASIENFIKLHDKNKLNIKTDESPYISDFIKIKSILPSFSIFNSEGLSTAENLLKVKRELNNMLDDNTVEGVKKLQKEALEDLKNRNNDLSSNTSDEVPDFSDIEDDGDLGLFRAFSESEEIVRWNPEKELRKLNRILPKDSRVEVVNSIKEVYQQGGQEAFGLFYDGVVYINTQAEIGTGYHEAFHAVFNMSLDEETKQRLLKETGVEDSLQAEEHLAEKFRDYLIKRQEPKSIFKKVFDLLIDLYNTVFKRKSTINGMFSRINLGLYRNKKARYKQTNSPRYHKYRDPNFTPTEWKNRISMINFHFFSVIQQLAQKEGLTETQYLQTLGDRGMNPVSIYTIVGARIKKERDKLAETNPNDSRVEKLDKILLSFIEKKDGKYLPKQLMIAAAQELKDYGLSVKVTEKINKKDKTFLFDLTEEDEIIEGWQKSVFETNGKDSLSFRVKLALRRIKDSEAKPDDLGFPKFVNFDRLYSKLESILAGKLSYEDMKAELESRKEINPGFKQILDLLESNENLRSEFFTNFAKMQVKYLFVRQKTESKDMGEGIIEDYTTFEIMDSNRNTGAKVITKDWESSINLNLPKESYELIKSKLEGFRKLDSIPNSAFVSILNELGLSVSEQDLASHKNDRNNNVKLINDIIAVTDSILAGQNPFKLGADNAIKSNINNLVRIVLNSNLNIRQASFRNVAQKTMYEYILPNFMSRHLERLKSDPAYLDHYLSFPFFKDSVWLKDLKTNFNGARDKFEFYYIDGLKFSKESEGTTYDSFSEADLETMKLNLFLNRGNDKYGMYAYPVLSDAPAGAVMQFRKYTETEVLNNFYELAKQEGERIRLVKSQKGLDSFLKIKNYHKHGDQFLFLPMLNGLTPEQLKDSRFVKSLIKDHFKKEVEAYKEKLARVGILGKKDNKFYIKNNLPKKVLDNPKYEKSLDEFLLDYLLNTSYANSQMMSLFSGDLAFYKNVNNSIIEDFVKRNKQTHAPVMLMQPGATWSDSEGIVHKIKEVYRTIYLKDKEVGSLYLKAMERGLKNSNAPKEVQEQLLKEYSEGINEADAQAYITLDRFREIYIGYGRWNNNYEEAYKRLKNKQGVFSDFKLFKAFQPIKPFYFDHIERSDLRVKVPTQNKNSEVVLIPQFIEGTVLETIHDFMQENEIGSVQFESAVKTGLTKVFSPENYNVDTVRTYLDTFKGKDKDYFSTALNNDHYGMQQELPEHHLDHENLLGTQARKHIIANLPEDFVSPSGRTKTDLLRDYNTAIRNNIQEASKEVFDSLYLNDDQGIAQINYPKLQDLLLAEAEDRGYDMSIYEGLELEVDPNTGRQRFTLPLFHPLYGKRPEQLINGLFKNRIVKQKFAGGTLVQVSAFGFSDKLKPPRGLTLEEASEILFKKDYYSLTGNQKQEVNDYFEKNKDMILPAEIMIPAWSQHFFNEDGSVKDINELPKEIADVVGYRIPTEGKYSMLTAKVVGFTPTEMGSVILVPTEITKIAGSDFDVDKLYMMVSEVGLDKEGKVYRVKGDPSGKQKRQRDNSILDVFTDILRSPQIYHQTIKPGGFENLKRFKDEILALEGKSKLERLAISPMTMSDLYLANMASKKLIGVFANHTANHSMLEVLKDDVEIVLDVKDMDVMNPLNDVVKINNTEGASGNISDLLAEFLAASVDNVKDPIFSYLNINSLTADYIAYMVRTGMSLERVIYFINQPIIKEVASEYMNQGAKPFMLDRILAAVLTKYTEGKNYPERSLDVKELKSSIDINNKPEDFKEIQIQVLREFKEMKDPKDRLGLLTRVLKFDSKGPGPTIAENEQMVDEFIELFNPETSLIRGLDELVNSNSNTTVPVDFIREGLLKVNTFFTKLYPYYSTNVLVIKDRLTAVFGKDLTIAQRDLVNTHIFDFILQGFPGYSFDSYEDKMNFIKQTETNFRTFKDKLSQDLFFSNLIFRNNSIEFISPGTLSEEEKKEIRDQIAFHLYENPDKEVSDYTRDIIRYGLVKYGAQFQPSSWMHLIPTRYYLEESFNGQTIKEYFDRETENLEVDNALFVENFVEQFVRNYPEFLIKVSPNKDTRIDVKKGSDTKAVSVKLADVLQVPYIAIGNRVYKNINGYTFYAIAGLGSETNKEFDMNSSALTINKENMIKITKDINVTGSNIEEIAEDLKINDPKTFDKYFHNTDVSNEFRIRDQINSETPTTSVPSDFTNHSGGALGADTQWDVIGREYGVVNHVHYWMNNKTPNGNQEISKEDMIEGQQKVTKAARDMGRIEPSHQVRDERLIRNWSQVKYSDAVFAITSLLEEGAEMNYGKKAKIRQGNGGTGYAVQMAINEGKPVYLYDQSKNQWYKNINGIWETSEVPKLTKNFAGIGTREINESGKEAIRSVYSNTFSSSNNMWNKYKDQILSKDSDMTEEFFNKLSDDERDNMIECL